MNTTVNGRIIRYHLKGSRLRYIYRTRKPYHRTIQLRRAALVTTAHRYCLPFIVSCTDDGRTSHGHRIVALYLEHVLYNYVQYECHMPRGLIRIRKMTTGDTSKDLIRIGLGVRSPKKYFIYAKSVQISALFYSFCVTTSLIHADFWLHIG